jgi:hypothetical protein
MAETTEAPKPAKEAKAGEITLLIRYLDNDGNEIEREERPVTVSRGKAEIEIKHMTRSVKG